MNRLALVLFCLCAYSRAADPTHVTTRLDVIHLPQAQAMKVIPLLEDSRTSAAAWHEIERESLLGRDGGAVIVHTLVTQALEGQQAVAKAVEGRQYPAQYMQEDPATDSPVTRRGKQEPSGYPFRSVYESSELGATLTIRAEMPAESGGVLKLSMAVQVSNFAGWTFFEAGVLPNGRVLRVQRPIVHRRVSEAVLVAGSGAPILVGSFKLPDEENRFELHVLTPLAKRLSGVPRAALNWKIPLRTDSPAPVDTPPRPATAYRAELLVFDVDTHRAVSMRSRIGRGTGEGDLLQELLADLPHNPGALIDRLSLPVIPGYRVVARGGTEVGYEVEMQAGPGPQTFGNGGKAPPAQKVIHLHPEPRRDPPSLFETRSIGTEFELEIDAGDSDPQHRNPGILSPRKSQFAVATSAQRGFHRWWNVVNPEGRITVQYYPNFESKQISGNASFSEGDVRLIGFHAEHSASKHCQLTFLRICPSPITFPKE